MPSIRPHLSNPVYNEITQGTVFCCASAARYESCEVFGLAITARCDIAQNKYSILNYLPVVRLADWLQRDGLDILVDQEENEQLGKTKGFLKQANLSISLLQSIPLKKIAEVHFPKDSTGKLLKTANNFREHITIVEEFQSIIESKKRSCLYDWMCQNSPKKIENLVKNLSNHLVAGHYLFEKIWPDGSEQKGYVCLLREVDTLPKKIACELAQGISAQRLLELCSTTKRNVNLIIPSSELAMPICLIGSPTIEHLMQSFSTLFGRIGLDDPETYVIEKLVQDCISD